MKIFSTLFIFVSLFFSFHVSAEKAPDSVLKLAPSLLDWGKNQTIIKAVNKQNSAGQSLDDIKKRDAEWRNNSGIDAGMKAMMENEAAKEMLKMEKSKPYFFEIFLMDNQGANVAMTNKTSDYWQGDEDKFTKSFNSGSGSIHIGDVEFDESAQAYLVQISVPVVDGGKTIGAMTIGVNIDELEAQ